MVNIIYEHPLSPNVSYKLFKECYKKVDKNMANLNQNNSHLRKKLYFVIIKATIILILLQLS